MTVTASFLDTTVLVNLSNQEEPAHTDSQTFVDNHQPCEVAYYASREMLAGPIGNICTAHNLLLASNNHAEALLAIERRFPSRSREQTRLELLRDLQSIFASDKPGTGGDHKREGLQAIKIRATQLWRRANNPKGVARVQTLACFNSGDLSLAASGELRGPNDSFACHENERCSAAAYLYDDPVTLTQMIDALHPSRLDDKAKVKRENSGRRRALRELKKDGPERFHKGRCRALGDAYFVAMCPKQSVIATTNLVDFEPLCKVLGKQFSKCVIRAMTDRIPD